MLQEHPSSQDLSSRLPWAGRFHVVRVVLVFMVLGVTAVQVAFCGRLTTYLVLLSLFGVVYPFLVSALLGRFEGRQRKGSVSLLLDGFFAGALIPAIAFEPVVSAVIGIISFFNWIAVGGFSFAANGLVAVLAGLGVSAAVLGLEPVRSCGPAGLLAYVILLLYLPFAGWAVFRYATVLRQRGHELQVERDRAESAHRQARRALLSVLPDSAARELAETGSVARRTASDATLLLAAVRWSACPDLQLAWLGEVLGPCQEILRRHRLELVKTFAGRFVALGLGDLAPDQAVAAAREIAAYFRDHGGSGPDGGSEWPFCLVVHCGSVECGLLQVEPLIYDIVGEPVDTALALAAKWDAPGVLVTSVARDRLHGEWLFQPLDEAEAMVFLLAERLSGKADLAT